MYAAIHGRGEEQACRADEQARHGIQRRERLERDTGTAFHRDEDRRRDQRASRKSDREPR